ELHIEREVLRAGSEQGLDAGCPRDPEDLHPRASHGGRRVMWSHREHGEGAPVGDLEDLGETFGDGAHGHDEERGVPPDPGAGSGGSAGAIPPMGPPGTAANRARIPSLPTGLIATVCPLVSRPRHVERGTIRSGNEPSRLSPSNVTSNPARLKGTPDGGSAVR